MPPKTYWCTKCNRFAISVNNLAPPCPIHGEDVMVDSPFDPRRIEPDAPKVDPKRQRRFSRGYTTDEILQKTAALEAIKSNQQIPIISNQEDDDLRHEVMMGLLARGCKVAISLPEPRHAWTDHLDPKWYEKFKSKLENCEFAIYARRPGSIPNPATELELQTLKQYGKKIIVYEKDK